MEKGDAEKRRAQAVSEISKLKTQLRQRGLSPEQQAEIRGELGHQYENAGAYIRARLNYSKAGDREAVAKSYEAQGNFKKAARTWYDHYEATTPLPDNPSEAELRKRLSQVKKVQRLYKKAGVEEGESFSLTILPDADNVYDLNERARNLQSELELRRLPPEERRKKKKKAKDLETISSGSDGSGVTMFAATGNPGMLGGSVHTPWHIRVMSVYFRAISRRYFREVAITELCKQKRFTFTHSALTKTGGFSSSGNKGLNGVRNHEES